MLIQATLLALLPATFPALAPQARGKVTPPPGMILIEGGTTKIGSTEKEILAIGQQDEKLFVVTVCETPQHEVRLDDFFLMTTSVTNEQYLAFVQGSNWRVPEHWAEKTIDEHQREYLEDLEQRIRAAREKGEPAPARVPFDRSDWWRRNWQDHTDREYWELPKGKESHPVVYVDFQDAQAYARWAGLRLMSEQEYQRAGRGSSVRRYPWGDEFDPQRALTTASRTDRPKAVGSMAEGATDQGIFELSGNVWEWTSSTFTPYPRWRVLQLEVGKGRGARKIDGVVAWDENKRVAVGGSYQNGEIAARLTTRRPTDRYQSTDSLGFRCAASVTPGRDIAETVMRMDVPPELRPIDVEYDLTKVVAMDRWKAAPGTVEVPGYGVIEGYDYLLYVPVVQMNVTSSKQLTDVSNESGPVALGILSLTEDSIEPPLPKGTYFVAFLGKGKPVEPESSSGMALPQDPTQEPAAEGEEELALSIDLPEGTDRNQDNLLFYSPDDVPVAALPVASMDFTRPKPPQVVTGEGTRVVMQPNRKGELEPVDVPCDQVILNVNSWVRVTNKGFNYNVVLKFEKGALGENWRR